MKLSNKRRFEIFQRDGFKCQYCGKGPPETVLEVDHIHPRSAGGTDEDSNLRTACWGCNSGKGARQLTLGIPYRLVGGPWAGRSYSLTEEWPEPLLMVPPGYYERPFLWLATDVTETLHAFEDSLLVSSLPTWPLPSLRLRIGHPWHSSALRGGDDPEWFFRRAIEGLHPRVIGGYWEGPFNDELPSETLEWGSADHLLKILA